MGGGSRRGGGRRRSNNNNSGGTNNNNNNKPKGHKRGSAVKAALFVEGGFLSDWGASPSFTHNSGLSISFPVLFGFSEMSRKIRNFD